MHAYKRTYTHAHACRESNLSASDIDEETIEFMHACTPSRMPALDEEEQRSALTSFSEMDMQRMDEFEDQQQTERFSTPTETDHDHDAASTVQRRYVERMSPNCRGSGIKNDTSASRTVKACVSVNEDASDVKGDASERGLVSMVVVTAAVIVFMGVYVMSRAVSTR